MPNLTLLESAEDVKDATLCQICVSKPGKYTCPRCNIGYCSLDCYQTEAHSNCSEAFYRECVMEDMKCQEDDPDAERKMMEILQRLQQTDAETNQLDSDDECESDLADRLSSVNLDDADGVWEKLTDTEKQEFEEFVRNGDVTKLIPSWHPWWKYRKEKKLVEEVGLAEEDLSLKDCPAVKTDIMPLSKLTKIPPADVVKRNVLNVLGAYCHVTRWFNGDHHSFSSEAVQALVALSGNLDLGHNYESSDLALEAVAHAAINCVWLGGSVETSLTMRSDVADILSGPSDVNSDLYLHAALSDILALLLASKKPQTASTKVSGKFSRRFGENLDIHTSSPAISKEKLRACKKKVEYYLSWSKEYAYEICESSAS